MPKFLKTANGLVNSRYIVTMFQPKFSEDYQVVYRRFGDPNGDQSEITTATAKEVDRLLYGDPMPC